MLIIRRLSRFIFWNTFMKLNKFIKKLEQIESRHGDSVEVLMADGIQVVCPVYLKDFFGSKAVIITDEK